MISASETGVAENFTLTLLVPFQQSEPCACRFSCCNIDNLKPLKILTHLLPTGRGWHGLLPTPTFTAFNLPQPLTTRSVSSWRSGWKLLKANGSQDGRHQDAFDSELRLIKLYKYRLSRLTWCLKTA
jgi:hypothetical protein